MTENFIYDKGKLGGKLRYSIDGSGKVVDIIGERLSGKIFFFFNVTIYIYFGNSINYYPINYFLFLENYNSMKYKVKLIQKIKKAIDGIYLFYFACFYTFYWIENLDTRWTRLEMSEKFLRLRE